MRPPPQRVIRSNFVKLDASGNGNCAITAPSGVRWDTYLTSINTTETNNSVKQPTFTLYSDSSPNRAHFLEGSYAGNRDASNTPHIVYGGESLCGEWIGGTPNSVATLQIAAMQQEL